MLLQRLVEYQPHEESGTPSRPYSRMRVARWELSITGNKYSLRDLSDPTDKARKNGIERLVPNVSRTSGIAPCLGADDVQYVLGLADDKAKPDRVAAAHTSFVDLVRRWKAEAPQEKAAQDLIDFYDQDERPDFGDKKWSSKDLVVIKVAGRALTDLDSLWALWEKVVGERKTGGTEGEDGRAGLCLVHGGVGPLLDRMPQSLPKALVPRAEQEIAVISANRRIHTFDGREGLGNAPICVTCGQSVVANLTRILSDDIHTISFDRQRTRIAWWITRGASSQTIDLLTASPTAVTDYLRQITDGSPGAAPGIDDPAFCSVTVSGNIARLVVHDWLEMPLSQAEDNVARWIQDMKIDQRWSAGLTGFGVSALLRCAGQWLPNAQGEGQGRYIPLFDKAADRPDDLAQTLVRAALHGKGLPPTVGAHIVRRIRTDLRIDAPRAALLRLALNRSHLRSGEGPDPVLDESNTSTPYVCGRLFATLEALQRQAYKTDMPNTTFFDRYWAGAIANPRIALNQGHQLSGAWLKKLRTPRDASKVEAERRTRLASIFKKRITELSVLASTPPRPLGTSEDQSWFILGYYHQLSHDTQRAIAARDRKTADTSTEAIDVLEGITTDEA
jgi:CRISPR-associated protein Csd1